LTETNHDAFFAPGSIYLVVGATENAEKYGSKVFLDLASAGYHVIAINNKSKVGDEIHGTPAYPSVTVFLERVSTLFDEKKHHHAIKHVILVLVVPPAAAFDVIKEAHLHSITKTWFQPGSESDEAIASCKKHGVDCVHDACIMVERPK